MYRKLTTVAAVAALTLGLAACGGGGSDGPTASAPPATTPPPTTTEPTTPMSEVVSLPANTPAGHGPMAGDTATIAAGGTHTSGGIEFTCADDGEACVVTVADDGTVSSTGGTVTAALTDAAQMAQETAALAMRDRVIGKDAALEGATNLAAASTTTALGEDGIRISRAARGSRPGQGGHHYHRHRGS